MSAPAALGAERGLLCDACGTPLDSRPFDAFARCDTADIRVGETKVLARFTLPAQYCGLLQCFSQYTDKLVAAHDHASPGFIWTLRMNGRALAPYQALDFIINPWGYGSFPVELRLDEASTIELAVRRVDGSTHLTEIGGRIAGRYWYNELYGSRARERATPALMPQRRR